MALALLDREARTAPRQATQRYLDEGGQQDAAHLLLQDDLVLAVVVTSSDERREQHFDQPRVAEVLEGQLAQLLQHRGVASRLHDDLGQRSNRSTASFWPSLPPFHGQVWGRIRRIRGRRVRRKKDSRLLT